jgi:hypothetical protein
MPETAVLEKEQRALVATFGPRLLQDCYTPVRV